jgi:pSer/pThr/pTyr-binding forkhead associated (FHA) protein
VIKLILEEGGDSRTLELDGDELTIGRTADNAVRVTDALSSRKHCRIHRTEDGFVVEDLKSRNGTTLNGKPLVAPKVLAIGDRIAIGLSVVHFGAKVDDGGQDAKPSAKVAKAAALLASGPVARPAAAASARSTKRLRFAFKFVDGEKKGKSVGIVSFPYTIGSKKNVSLSLEAEEVSAEHCMLVEDEGAVHVVHLNSEHGTFVDGKRIKGREKLRPNAILTLGKTTKLKWKDLATKAASDDDLEPAPGNADKSEKPEKAEKEKAARPVEEVTDLESLGDEEGETRVPDDEGGAKPSARPSKAVAKASPGPTPKAGRKGRPVLDDSADALLSEGDETGIAASEFSVAAVGDEGGGALGAIAVVLLIVVIAGAAVPVVLSALAREDRDPEPTGNLVKNWSFEEDPALQGWSGDAKVLTEDVAYGKRAVRLDASSETHGELRSAEATRLQPGKWLVLNGAVRTSGSAAAILAVEWTDERRSDWKQLSYSAVAYKQSTWAQVGNTAIAPPENATHGRVLLFASSVAGGSGSAVFDRIVLKEEDAPAGTPGLKAAGLDVSANPRGLLTLARQGKSLAQFELMLGSPDGKRGDPLASEEAWTVTSAAQNPGDGGIFAEGTILDTASGDRVNAALIGKPVGEGLRLSYEIPKKELADGREVRVTIVVPRAQDLGPVELASASGSTMKLEDAFAKANYIRLEKIVELAWGSGADQASIRTFAPVDVEVEKTGSGLRIELVSVPAVSGDVRTVGLDLAKASSLARERVRSLFERAETAKKENRLEDARATYARIAREFSHEPSVAGRARKAATELAQRADRLLEAVKGAADDAEELALPELARAARAWEKELEHAFPGASQLEKANALATRVEEKTKAAGARTTGVRARELVARAMKHREAGRLKLARTIYRFVIASFPPDDAAAVEAKEKLAAMPPEEP